MPATPRIEFEDLMPWYNTNVPPEYTQEYLDSNWEFARFKSILGNQILPPRGKYFDHQQVDAQYMRFKNKLFFRDKQGTGKSGNVISIAETLIRDPSTPYYRAYIVVRGRKLVKEWQHNITCLTSPGTYDELNPEVGRAKTKTHQIQQSNREIAKVYAVITYDELVKRMRVLETDEQLQEAFAGTLIYIDESHNLRLREDEGDQEKISGEKPPTIVPAKTPTDAKKKKTPFTKIELNKAIDRIFNQVYPIKKMMGTGSAEINHPADLADQVNKFLPVDKRFPDTDEFWENVSLDTLLYNLGDLFTYIRPSDYGLNIKFKGITLPTINMPVPGSNSARYETVSPAQKVMLVPMSRWQADTYREILRSKVSYRTQERQAAIITYPDRPQDGNWQTRPGIIGQAGYASLLQVNPARKTIDEQSTLTVAAQQLLAEYGEIMSSRIMFVVNEIMNDLRRGVRCKYFIFSYFLVNGLYPLAKMLELMIWQQLRFTRFSPSTPMFADSTFNNPNKVTPICELRGQPDQRLTTIAQANRYAIIVSGSGYENVRDAWNSNANMFGDYIRALLVSDSGREGLSFTDTPRVFLLHADWDPAAEAQALYRVIRAGAFNNLMRYTNGPVEVLIYRMASVALERNQEAGYLEALRQDNTGAQALEYLARTGKSVDRDLYYLTAYKDKKIARLRLMLKQIAITCRLFHARNIQPGDVDFSPECEYQPCKYECAGKQTATKLELSYNNYDNLYSEQERQLITNKIKEYFTQYFIVNYSTLYDHLKDHRPTLILRTICDIITQRTIIYNRFGTPCYLQENGDVLILSSDYPLQFYSPMIIASSYYTTHEFRFRDPEVTNLGLVWWQNTFNPEALWQQLVQAKDETTLKYWLDSLDVYSQAYLFERTLISGYQASKSWQPRFDHGWQRVMLGKYTKQLFINIPYPTLDIERLQYQNPYRQAPPHIVSYTGSNDLMLVHSLYRYQLATESKHGQAAREVKLEGRLRILRFVEGLQWRDATNYEYIVLSDILSKQLKAIHRQQGMTDTIIYKLEGPNEILKVLFPLTDEQRQRALTDSRLLHPGIACTTVKAGKLADLLWDYQLEPPHLPENSNYPVNMQGMLIYGPRNKTPAFFRELRPETQQQIIAGNPRVVEFYYRWYKVSNLRTSGWGRANMCETLKRYLKQANLISYD